MVLMVPQGVCLLHPCLLMKGFLLGGNLKLKWKKEGVGFHVLVLAQPDALLVVSRLHQGWEQRAPLFFLQLPKTHLASWASFSFYLELLRDLLWLPNSEPTIFTIDRDRPVNAALLWLHLPPHGVAVGHKSHTAL